LVPVDLIDVRAGQQGVRGGDLVGVGFGVVLGAGVHGDDDQVGDGGYSASRDGSRWRLRPGPRVLAITDTVAELNQVEIAMLCALTAGLQVPPRPWSSP
jgi:hypothetical protein